MIGSILEGRRINVGYDAPVIRMGYLESASPFVVAGVSLYLSIKVVLRIFSLQQVLLED